MILSKANLTAVIITADDKSVPMLNNLYVEADGTTVAANSRCMLAVSPVPDEVRGGLGYMEDSGSVGNIIVAADTVKEVLRNMPRDTKFGGLLEYTDLKKGSGSSGVSGGDGVTFRLRDGMRDRSIGAKIYSRTYFDYKSAFQKAAEAGAKARVVLNRKRLISLLETMDKICPDSSGESPVYLEITTADDILIKTEGHHGQRVIGFMKAYQDGESNWLSENKWEAKMKKRKTRGE